MVGNPWDPILVALLGVWVASTLLGFATKATLFKMVVPALCAAAGVTIIVVAVVLAG